MRARKGHLFFKIFISYLLSSVLIVGFLFSIFKAFEPNKTWPPIFHKNVKNYFELLGNSLKKDPSVENFNRLEEEFGILVRMEGLEDIANQKNLPQFSDIDFKQHEMINDIQFGKVKKYFFLTVTSIEPRTVWFVSFKKLPKPFSYSLFSIVGFILFILAMSFISVGWMMWPIKVIFKGIDQLGSGNLKYRMSVKHKGEFKKIASTFNKMAERIEKMITEKDQLIRDVSHELRSPLTRMNVVADLMEESELKKSLKEDLGRVDSLIHQILDSYRLKSGQQKMDLVKANLSEITSNIVKEYNSKIHTITSHIEPGVIAFIDPMQIERVFRNLIENAIKYSQKNIDHKPIDIDLREEKKAIVFRIKDYGVGISESDISHIFEPFYRADLARTPGAEGFGLGLSICKAIIEAHNGEITVQSELGQGTEFTIRINK